MSNKPVVYYVKESGYNVTVGSRANVDALNHPKFGKNNVHTSTVLAVDLDGTFETRNTIYKPNIEELTAAKARSVADSHIDNEKQIVFNHILSVAKNGHYYTVFSRMSDQMKHYLGSRGYTVQQDAAGTKVSW